MTAATAGADRRRTVAVLALLATAVTATAGLAGGLRACEAPGSPRTAGTIPATPAQARLLASMRYANYLDSRVGFQAVLGSEATGVRLTGWVDWRQPLVYLASLGTTPSAADGLIQAVPGAMAVRPGRPATVPAASAGASAPVAVDPFPPPPVVPPADGWRVRPFGTAGSPSSPLDTLLALLFTIATTTPDDPALMAGVGPRFVRRDKVAGVPVDVLDGPAVPPRFPVRPSASPSAPAGVTAPVASPTTSGGPAAPFAAYGGEVTYWLDATGRVRRLDALVGTNLPARVDFRRDDRTAPAAIEALGGAPVHPRPVTPAEAALLARLRVRDRSVRGGEIDLRVPAQDGTELSARGWLDWRSTTAYLTVRDLDDPAQDTLVRVDRDGVAVHRLNTPASGPPGTPANPRPTPSAAATDRPPLPPPAGGWQLTAWQQRGDAEGASDLDILLNEALTLSATQPDSATDIAGSASFLRTDSLSGVPVTVFEVRKPVEASVPAGLGRLRYWVDATGLLRRLEVRTRTGGFGYLDVAPATVPPLPAPAA